MNRKRIIFTILPLLILNLFLVFNLFWQNNIAKMAPDSCLDREAKETYPESSIFPEEVDCVKRDGTVDEEFVPKGKILYHYYGEDAECWEKWRLNPERLKMCLEETPYGGAGTFVLGGNMVVNDASYLYFNGFDNSGMHWLMTTTSEPIGNVMGLKTDTQNIYLNNNFQADRGIDIPKLDRGFGFQNLDAGMDNMVIIQNKNRKIGKDASGDDIFEDVDHLGFGASGGGGAGLEILADPGVGGSKWYGDNYRYLTDELEVKGNLQAENKIRICRDTLDGSDCNVSQYRVENLWSFMDKAANKDEEFVKFKAQCCSEVAHPQPFPHYKVINHDTGSYDGTQVPTSTGMVVYMGKRFCDPEHGADGIICERPTPQDSSLWPAPRENVSAKEWATSSDGYITIY